jgi:hypothetical protein
MRMSSAGRRRGDKAGLLLVPAAMTIEGMV